MAQFTTSPDSHYHGLSNSVRDYVLEAIRENSCTVEFKVGENADSPFVIATVELHDDFGTVPCDLRGPIMGDAPVLESDVLYANRPGVESRTWDSRLVAMPPKASRLVTVIASEGGVITMFGGPLSPQEKLDPSAFDPSASALFWGEHALSTESLTREG